MKQILRELGMILSSRIRFLLGSSQNKPPVFKNTSRGLFVLIPGLNAHPHNWNKYIEKIGEEYDVWCPFIFKQGHCTLEEAVDPIYQQIKEYKKPICLIGHSNGARIAYALDLLFRKESKTPVMVVALSAVPFGTTVSNYLARFFKSPAYEKLTFRNPELLQQITDLQQPTNVKRSYLRYSSRKDPFISADTAFPPLYKHETDIWLDHELHATLLKAVVDPVVTAGKEFICVN